MEQQLDSRRLFGEPDTLLAAVLRAGDSWRPGVPSSPPVSRLGDSLRGSRMTSSGLYVLRSGDDGRDAAVSVS